ncbi:MAG TPA: 50S ribosomal protein L23 [Bacteroidota bacterium]|jgi:large subunit ribosomal protein L23|nr:50S ribosomal protein L23 [Bacteroidota bacterium]
MNSIIKRPILTEKMTTLGEHGQYAFEVDVKANKIEIAKAISKRFSVDVASIRTILYKGKRKAQFTKRGRLQGSRPSWKKAIVTLKKGQTIELLEA